MTPALVHLGVTWGGVVLVAGFTAVSAFCMLRAGNSKNQAREYYLRAASTANRHDQARGRIYRTYNLDRPEDVAAFKEYLQANAKDWE